MSAVSLRVLAFGACQLSAALTPLVVDKRIALTNLSAGIWEIAVYSLAEVVQRIQFVRGELEIPRNLYYYCCLPEELDPKSDRLRLFEEADTVLLEPNSYVNTCFGPYALNRSKLLSAFLNPLAKLGKEANAASNDWFYRGILAGNEDKKRAAAEKLIPLLPGTVEDVETVRELLLGMRGVSQDREEFFATIAELGDMCSAPMGLIGSINGYLPDGRPLPWPPDLLENIIAAGKKLGLPVFNPADIVVPYGVAKAMNEPLKLYRREFTPVIAEPLFRFCEEVSKRGQEAAPGRQVALSH